MCGGARGGGEAQRADSALVGRAALLDELDDVARAAAGGTGTIVLLTGEAGIGKTSVARALAARARDALAVSWGTCAADQSAPPFWPWRDLVEADPSPAAAGDSAIGAPRYERLTTLRSHVLGQLDRQPRLHIIEDLQWADVASVLLLRHLGEVIQDVPLLVVATVRTGEPRSTPLDEAIEEVHRSAVVRELAPLADRDLATLLHTTGTDEDEELLALVRERTGGNPLFVTELLRAVPVDAPAARRLAVVAATVPARVSDLALRRLRRLPGAVAGALTTAAVLGAEGDVGTLAAAHGTEVDAVLELLDQARAAHLLGPAAPGRWQFRHQLVRDAVYAGTAEAERSRHHARVLEALAADPVTAPATLAHHALAALPVFDADRAVALAARAGTSAFAQHAYEEAITWFTRALAAAPPTTSPRWRAELLVLCGEAHRHVGDLDPAREAFLAAAGLTDDPALLARAALGFASPGADLGIAYRTDEPRTVELLEAAIEAQPTSDAATVVRLEARLAAELYFSDEPARARALARSALDRARRLGDPAATCVATAVVHDALVVGQAELDEQLAGSARLVELARTSGSTSALLSAHRARVLDLLAAGDLVAMDTEVLAFRRLAEPLRAPGYLWWLEVWSAMRALLEGRHAEAEARAVAAYEVGVRPFPTLAMFNLSFLLFFLRREQGRLAELEEAARDYAASRADVPALRVALAFLLAELGRLDEARGALAAFDAAALDRLHDRNWPASWFQLARAASLVDDTDLGRALLDRQPSERCVQVSLATVCLGSTDLAAAWLLHAAGDLDAADLRYRSAQDVNHRIGARAWLAQARADHARLLLERAGPGDRDEAVRLRRLAAETARALGLATIDGTDAEATGSPVPPVAPPATFRRDGSVWELAYGGRVAQVADARGLRDLAYLLSRPGEAISVLELAGAPPTAARGAEALDERARQEIRARLQDLDDAEAEAEAAGDGERAALVREQRQVLAEAVARDFGLGGRPRLLGDPVERARKTVSTRIRRTIATVGRAHPELGRHLERSIDTGAWCAYRPAEPVTWRT